MAPIWQNASSRFTPSMHQASWSPTEPCYAMNSSFGVLSYQPVVWWPWKPAPAPTTGPASWWAWAWMPASSRPIWWPLTGCKAERCGSNCACAQLDSAKKAGLRPACGLQGKAERTMPTMPPPFAKLPADRRCTLCRSKPSSSKACCVCTACAKAEPVHKQSLRTVCDWRRDTP